MQLDCTAQNYAWGIKGNASMVAKFKAVSSASSTIAEDQCYAELWMGTHPSGPARVIGTDELLADRLVISPSSVGIVPEGYPADNLPFLFKVLSVQTALSIQTHPDKALAQELHSRFPDIYKDANHKPEMVIALTPFECMCGFRALAEIAEHLRAYPEFRQVVDHRGEVSSVAEAGDVEESAALRGIFEAVMSCPAPVYSAMLSAMITRLRALTSVDTTALSPVEDLMLRLNEQYPGDIGVFSPLFTNYVRLQPGQSFFIGANELHAYISGECVECMALSDNVVRAGLTPKLKDCETLCKMLTYKSRLPSFLTPQPVDSCTSLYRPPVDGCAEFEVELIEIPPHTSQYHPVLVNCGCILLLLRAGDTPGNVVLTSTVGTGEAATKHDLELREGAVVFSAALEDVTITTGDVGATFYRAHVNLGGTAEIFRTA